MRNIKKMVEKVRVYIGRCIISLFLMSGLLITIIGGVIPLYQFYYAPNYSFQPNFSGFGVARNGTNISPDIFVVSITIEPPELYFHYSFSCSENGTYNFLFWFPFKIIRKTSSSVNMSFNATSKGSAIWLQYHVDNVHYDWAGHHVSGVFSIENTFQSGNRGYYMFILPFGLGIPSELVQSIQRELNVGFITPPSAYVDLSFGVPGGYHITQTFPQHSVGPNTWTTPRNRTITKVGWTPSELRDSMTIYCQNPDEIARYQSLLFIGGLCLGIGGPMITTAFYDIVKNWSKSRRPDDSSIRFDKEGIIIIGIIIGIIILVIFMGILEAYVFLGTFDAILTAIAAIVGYVGGRYIYDDITKPRFEILRTDCVTKGYDKWWRVIVKNRGLTAAENCNGLIYLSGSDSEKELIDQKGSVCWSALGNPSTITLNVEDEASLDVYWIHHGLEYVLVIPTEKGWDLPRFTTTLDRLVKPAELVLKVRITAKNAKPIERTYALEVQDEDIIPQPR